MTHFPAADVTALLRRHDPLGLIEAGAPADEYQPEAGTITPRLAQAMSAEDVQDILHTEFQAWFTPNVAGPRERYLAPATELWQAVSG